MNLQIFISIILLPAVLAGLLYDISSINAHNTLDSAREMIRASLEPSTSWERSQKDTQLEIAIKNLSAVSKKKRLRHELQHEAGKSKLLSALKTSDSTDKLHLLCKARSYFKLASQKSPVNPEYHLSIVDIESLSPLLATSCDSETSAETNLTPIERLSWVSEIAPADLTSIYKSAIIYDQIGEREKALNTYRRYQELTLVPTWQIRERLVEQPKNQKELLVIIPRKYPEILTWMHAYKKASTEKFIADISVFEQVLNEIIEDTLLKLTKKEISESQFIEMLSHLNMQEILSKSNFLHSKVNTLLYEYYKTTNKTFALFITGKFSNLERAPILKSLQFSKKSPRSGSLYNWIHDQDERNVSLDLRASHLGFFSPANSDIRFITIQGSPGQIMPDNIKIKILTSNDNLDFSPFQGEFKQHSGDLNGIPFLTIELPRKTARYTKLYFQSGSTLGGTISNKARDILQAYTEGSQ
jgi:hypothetical protein